MIQALGSQVVTDLVDPGRHEALLVALAGNTHKSKAKCFVLTSGGGVTGEIPWLLNVCINVTLKILLTNWIKR
jgi:hypothetical protein